MPFCAYEFSSERLEVVGSKLASPTGFEPVLPPLKNGPYTTLKDLQEADDL